MAYNLSNAESNFANYGLNPNYCIIIDAPGQLKKPSSSSVGNFGSTNNTGQSSDIDTSGQVVAALPDQVSFDMSAQFESPFQDLGQAVVDTLFDDLGLSKLGNVAGKVARLAGYSMMTQEMTIKVWQGSSGLGMQIPLVFSAYANTYADVTAPTKALLKLIAPRPIGSGNATSGLLTSPGPRVRFAKGTNLSTITKTLKPGQGNGSFSNLIHVDDPISVTLGNHLHFNSVVITRVSPTYDVRYDIDGRAIYAVVDFSFEMLFDPTANNIDEIVIG